MDKVNTFKLFAWKLLTPISVAARVLPASHVALWTRKYGGHHCKLICRVLGSLLWWSSSFNRGNGSAVWSLYGNSLARRYVILWKTITSLVLDKVTSMFDLLKFRTRILILLLRLISLRSRPSSDQELLLRSGIKWQSWWKGFSVNVRSKEDIGYSSTASANDS